MTRKGKKQKPQVTTLTKYKNKESKKTKQKSKGKASRKRLVEAVCSQIDPFCKYAVGAKMYDSSTWPSHTITSRKLIEVVTDANGAYALRFDSLPANYYKEATTIVSNVVTVYGSANEMTNYAQQNVLYSHFRIVTSGLKFFSSVDEDKSKGLVTVMTDYENDESVLHGLLSTAVADVSRTRLRDAEVTWIAVSSTATGEYREFDSTATADDPQNSRCVFAITGATASTSVGYLELVTHYECRSNYASAAAASTTPAAPRNHLVTSIVSNVAKQLEPATIANHITTGKRVVKAIEDVMDTVGGMLSAAPYLLTLL